MSLLVILAILLLHLCLLIEILYTLIVVHQESSYVIPSTLLTPNRMLATNRERNQKLFGKAAEEPKTALCEDGRNLLLLGHLVNAGLALLPD